MTIMLHLDRNHAHFQAMKVNDITLDKPTFFVGDVHGQNKALRRLLDTFKAQNQTDARLIFLGDLTDRGPDSTGVLHTVFDDAVGAHIGATEVHRLWGNHDLMFVEVLERLENETIPMRAVRGGCWDLWHDNGGRAVLKEHTDTLNNESLLRFLQNLGFGEKPGKTLRTRYAPPMRLGQDGRVLAVHAGIQPNRPVQDSLNQTPEQWKNTWGDTNTLHWAWTRYPFVTHQEPIFAEGSLNTTKSSKGMLVFHGHTVMRWIEIMVEDQNPNHLFKTLHGGGVNIDLGAAIGWFVGGALLTNTSLTLFAEPCSEPQT